MIKRLIGLICLILGGIGLWFSATGSFDDEITALPNYSWLAEIRGLEAEGRLAEAEHLADWVLEGSDIPNREEVATIVLPFPSAFSVFETNCIVIWRGRLAVVVDPGGEAAKIARFLKRNKLKVGEYWLTHAHPDHVGGIYGLLGEFPAPVRYHSADSRWMKFSFLDSKAREEWFRPFGAIRRIACGAIAARVILTPGHTRGGVCYWFEELGVLLSGDTLMRGYIGLTWFPGGNADELNASLRKIHRRVPDDTKIFPGHGSRTTVGAELVAS